MDQLRVPLGGWLEYGNTDAEFSCCDHHVPDSASLRHVTELYAKFLECLNWQRQAAELGFSAAAVRANARQAERGRLAPDLFATPGYAAGEAAAWAVAHLAERQAVFGHADLVAATLAREPGAVTVEAAERAIAVLERQGALHAARGLDHGRHWTTEAAMAREMPAAVAAFRPLLLTGCRLSENCLGTPRCRRPPGTLTLPAIP